MEQDVELKCDTFNDKNTYYVIDGNLGIEHELHGSVQFKVVNEKDETVYKSHIFSTDYFIQQFKIFEKEQVKPDEYKVIMAGNIMVAQGYECSKCKVIRAYNQPTCNCH